MSDLDDRSRFLLLGDVSAELNVSDAQVYALVRSGDLAAIKIGGHGLWRVERIALEAFITRLYAETRQFVAKHPRTPSDDTPPHGG